jgi:hypothetical protein
VLLSITGIQTVSYRNSTMKKIPYLLPFLVSFFAVAQAQNNSPGNNHVVVGVNVVNPMRASVDNQNIAFSQLKAAGVHVIRCGIATGKQTVVLPGDKGINYAKRAAAHGIKIQLIIDVRYAAGAPARLYGPANFPQMWGGSPLSAADPVISKKYYQSLFDMLDENGIVLAGIELGNEINWAAFNPEFPLPGEGKILSLNDLHNDPEGKQIAKGFIQYLKVLAALKSVRDHSRLNSNTPLISAGLVSAPDGDKLYNNKKEDMVSLPGTIAFLRQHGLDTLVDAYGIHTYPSAGQPGNPVADAKRAAVFNNIAIAACRPAGNKNGKPGWITEWGFNNKDMDCPVNDADRTLLVKQMMGLFTKAAAQGKLAGINYFAWDSDPWAKQPEPYSIYRCGGLTESGHLAIKPIK